ncbi:MAG: phage Gp37/Gp68 family protein [Treponema sp.]|nr:phage Gp37/Gp68 family protein [Treponema sp.]
MKRTSIAWTDMTWNPVTGCTKCSPGCQNCYAEKMASRLKSMGLKKYGSGFSVALHPEALSEPSSVKEPKKIFVCSMGDLFHEAVPFWFVDKVMNEIREADRHTFIILTKRAERMEEYFARFAPSNGVPENAWLGVTVECASSKKRMDSLRRIRFAPVRFVSCEPLVEGLGEMDLEGIDWVICGGESGPAARAMNPEWARCLRGQCERKGVPFFFKQWGTWGADGAKRDKKRNGFLLDGKVVQEWPKAASAGEF